MLATPAKVQAALRREARDFNARYRGTHRFGPIYQSADRPGCNWSADFRATGSGIELAEMRKALERVQTKMPMVQF